MTPYLTTVRTGTRGNSGFKSVKKYSIPSRKHRKAPQITTKNLVQAFGIRRPGVRIPALRPVRRKHYIACGEFFHFIVKLIVHSFCDPSFPNRNLERSRWRLCRLTDAACPLRVLRRVMVWVPPLCGGFICHEKNIDFNRPSQKGGHDLRSCPPFWASPRHSAVT